jgi:hypothetical protein
MRCVGKTGQRQQCTDSTWVAAEPCGNNEACSADDSAAPGSCQPITEVCRGSAGLAVCDGQGVMYLCDSQGVAASKQTCASAQHCQKGIDSRACVACIPGESRCTGATLERCDEKGSAFVQVKDCGTVALCNTSLGECSSAACALDKHSCDGDALLQCKNDQSGFEKLESCGPGLCDSDHGQCDRCVAGTGMCSGANAMICNADGQAYDTMSCAGTKPHCVGNGRCVQCAADSDCADPGACNVKHCNLGTGTCESQFAAVRSQCTGGQLCDGAGHCFGCLSANDCDDPGVCKQAYCNESTHTCAPKLADSSVTCSAGHCDNGSCVECSTADECPNKVCQTKACSGGKCSYANIAPGKSDKACSSGKVCSAALECVDCVDNAQCQAGQECSNNKCQALCGNNHIDANEECEPRLLSRPQDAKYCDAKTCKFLPVFNASCAGLPGAGGSGPECTPSCSTTWDCPTPHGSEVVACETDM